MSNVVHLTDSDFQTEVLEADLPVLVDFWATWCAPCQMVGPIIEEVADEYLGKLKVCKMDVDNNTDTPSQYGIRGIPTMLIFKNGKIEATKVGALPKNQLLSFIDNAI